MEQNEAESVPEKVPEKAPKKTATAVRNSDGSTIVTLTSEIKAKVDGREEKLTRVTIPALKGKHMRLAPFKGQTTIGQLVDFAALVVEPSWAVDEMSPDDAIFCALEVREAWSKSSE